MSMADRIKPISYLKANAAKIAQELKEGGGPYIITQNGEAAMVVQSVREFEQMRETLAMLQILEQGRNDIEQGKTIPAAEAIQHIRDRLGIQ